MTDVFVSYKAEDRSRVAPLVEALETDGLSVWWDAHIGGGDEWRDTILPSRKRASGDRRLEPPLGRTARPFRPR